MTALVKELVPPVPPISFVFSSKEPSLIALKTAFTILHRQAFVSRLFANAD